MKQFPNGVKFYTEATCTVFFPENDICCHWCHLLRMESRTDRYYCSMTGEYIPVPQVYTGHRCPLEFKKENNDA